MSSNKPYTIDPNFIKEIDIEKKLDELLQFQMDIFVEQQLYPTNKFDPFEPIAREISNNLKTRFLAKKICISDDLDQQKVELKILYDRLIEDNYVIVDNHNYLLTAKGMIFLKDNGYREERKRKNRNKIFDYSKPFIGALIGGAITTSSALLLREPPQTDQSKIECYPTIQILHDTIHHTTCDTVYIDSSKTNSKK